MRKRLLDIVLAAVLLVVSLPVLILVAGLVRMLMGPPLLFRQVRPGVNGEPFTLVKFRTMRPAPGSPESSDEARITRLGALLRRTSLDELPELWNVLKGDMSLVGPRPLLMEYTSKYSPHQARRLEVKPGLTGLAQVSGRNALTWEEKFDLDIWYVDHQTLGLDFRILGKTLWHVVTGRGISAPGHATMPEFEGEPGRPAEARSDEPPAAVHHGGDRPDPSGKGASSNRRAIQAQHRRKGG